MDKAVVFNRYGKRLIVSIATAALLSSAAASKQTPHYSALPSGEHEEPFRSFRIMDAKLTLLSKQEDVLKDVSNSTAPDSGAASEQIVRRQKACRNMKVTTAEIERLAAGLERLYERRHQSFGVQMFRVMRIKAEQV
jgi:hypothetical protein